MRGIAVGVAGLLALGGAMGCAGAANKIYAPRDPAEREGYPDLPSFTYFIVTRPDARECLYPRCGGYFVKRVNRATTLCADGIARDECHVAALDLDALGPRDAPSAEFAEAFGQRRAIVRGRLEQIDERLPSLVDTLIATEGWRGVTASEPTGHVSLLTSTGIVCTTFPCP